MVKVFSYGTLQDPYIQNKYIGRTLSSKPDSVSGFRREEIKIESTIYWILVPDKHTIQLVCGQVFEITEKELSAFDEYEGKEYQRTLITLESGNQAWVYHK